MVVTRVVVGTDFVCDGGGDEGAMVNCREESVNGSELEARSFREPLAMFDGFFGSRGRNVATQETDDGKRVW